MYDVNLFCNQTVVRTASYFLDSGHWFLSLYNDDGDSQMVTFVAKVSGQLNRDCPGGCNGRGDCVLGRCQCEAGFDGPDCGQSELFNLIMYVVPWSGSKHVYAFG